MSASTTVRHMLNNSIIMLCSVCVIHLHIKHHGRVQSAYLSSNPYKYISMCVYTYKGKGKVHPRRGHKGPEGGGG